jgi:hypothetical protein
MGKNLEVEPLAKSGNLSLASCKQKNPHLRPYSFSRLYWPWSLYVVPSGREIHGTPSKLLLLQNFSMGSKSHLLLPN